VIKVAISLMIVSAVVLLISVGILYLSEFRLDELPENPVHQLVIAEKKNLTETKNLSQVGILIGAITVGISGLVAGLLYWRS
jgi:hypothetical protein